MKKILSFPTFTNIYIQEGLVNPYQSLPRGW